LIDGGVLEMSHVRVLGSESSVISRGSAKTE
jgi:hypothetical protein